MNLIYQSMEEIEDSNALHTSKVRSNSYFVIYFFLYSVLVCILFSERASI